MAADRYNPKDTRYFINLMNLINFINSNRQIRHISTGISFCASVTARVVM